jgi:hypothetical protein
MLSEQLRAGAAVPAISRRDALKRGALVGGSLVWTVPVVQAVSLTAAHAENPSAPPVGGGGSGGGGISKPSTPAGPAAPIGRAAPLQPEVPAEQGGGRLPFTGTSVSVLGAAAVGAGLVTTGVAATVVAGRVKAAATDTEAVPPVPPVPPVLPESSAADD